MTRLLLLLPALLLLGCGSLVSSTGELGRVNYSLASDFLVDGGALVDQSVLAGHVQQLNLTLTSSGESRGGDFAAIEHLATPSDGVSIEADANSSDEIGRIYITVTEPGDYLIETLVSGDLFDRINLTFDVPSSLDVITWVRPPNAEDFVRATGSPFAVEEGTQAAFVPIPLDAQSQRIAGDFIPVLSADPEWAVVRGQNVLGIYEQGVIVTRSPASVYFIEPGAIGLNLRDDVNDVDVDVEFDVAPVEVPAQS